MSGSDDGVLWFSDYRPDCEARVLSVVPSRLGPITRLFTKNDRLVVETESGVAFIMPTVEPGSGGL